MARIRTIKPELLEDGKVARLPHLAWRLFVSLILLADDYGNLRGDPERIHGAVLWAHPREDSRDPREDFREALNTLLVAEFVIAYEVREQLYLHIANWEKHQKVDHPGRPLCPALIDGVRVPRETFARPSETLAPDLGSGSVPGSGPRPATNEGGVGARAHTRSNDDAALIPLDPVPPELRRWGGEEWYEAFRIAWLTYRGDSYGGRPNDFSAVGSLRTILSNLPLESALAAQERAPQMFAEFFGDDDEPLVKARHPWSWFVQRFDGLRFPRGPSRPRKRTVTEENVAALDDWQPPEVKTA